MVGYVEDGAKCCEHVALWNSDKGILIRVDLDLEMLDAVVDHEIDVLWRVLPPHESAAGR